MGRYMGRYMARDDINGTSKGLVNKCHKFECLIIEVRKT